MDDPLPPTADRFADTYEELRRLAHAQLRRHERSGLLDTTALVHESWLRVAQSKGFTPEDERHFLCYAAKVMRSVIVDHARARNAERRGGGLERTTLNSRILENVTLEDGVLRVDEALDLLEAADARLARIVELRFFAGLTAEEAAEALEMSPRTLYREWEKARLILADAIRTEG
ncbi:MAG: sigma-70 family RNA polymerase sigma factor [Betaproteobacteria bacterium]|nr:sigma-70 family RNA polymerase sigma factor [Betaproteobacteria bacterium]